MATYKISGITSHDTRAHVIKSGSYVGYRDISTGPYDLVFDADNANDVLAVAERNSNGETLGFGNVDAISTGDSPNLTLPATGLDIKNFDLHNTYIPNGSSNRYLNLGKTYDVTKTMILMNGLNNDNSGGSFNDVNLTVRFSNFNNGNQLTLGRNDNDGNTYVDIILLEVNSGFTVKAHNFVGVGDNNLTGDRTISAVDLSKSFINHCGQRINRDQARQSTVRLSFVNNTTVRATRFNGDSTITCDFQVIQFDDVTIG